MPGVVRLGDNCSGHGGWTPRPVTSASTNVLCNGIGVARVTDTLAIHCLGVSCHAGVISGGSSSVYVNGLQIARVGDPVDCGSVLSGSSSNTNAGG